MINLSNPYVKSNALKTCLPQQLCRKCLPPKYTISHSTTESSQRLLPIKPSLCSTNLFYMILLFSLSLNYTLPPTASSAMPSTKKKFLSKTVLTAANSGCGCRRSKPSDVHEPSAVPRSAVSHQTDPPTCISSSSTRHKSGGNEESCTSTITTSVSDENDPKDSKIINSIAVVKDSNDPYQDFRHSMLQMIFEKEIYSKDDLQELLNCFLELNSPYHHGLIIQAFTEIWNDVISKKLNKSQN